MSEESAKKKKILLVEDDLALAQVYKSRLELEGFEVLHSEDGEKALTEVIDFMPDLILLDVMMPKINGFDVLDILRNAPQTKDVNVIMLTALSQPKDMERAADLGADEYLIKSQVVIGDVVNHIKNRLGLV
ncbi:MAG: response regulator [Candidatus Nomurabacteria bacterium]|jgi:two-component system phosphate regulon response regulator PhoB|nr:response regulator [Candidatus Nomurabacteria bacterium]